MRLSTVLEYQRVGPAEWGIAGVAGQGATVERGDKMRVGWTKCFCLLVFVYMFDGHQLAFGDPSVCCAWIFSHTG